MYQPRDERYSFYTKEGATDPTWKSGIVPLLKAVVTDPSVSVENRKAATEILEFISRRIKYLNAKFPGGCSESMAEFEAECVWSSPHRFSIDEDKDQMIVV
jgi:hypothetical protein